MPFLQLKRFLGRNFGIQCLEVNPKFEDIVSSEEYSNPQRRLPLKSRVREHLKPESVSYIAGDLSCRSRLSLEDKVHWRIEKVKMPPPKAAQNWLPRTQPTQLNRIMTYFEPIKWDWCSSNSDGKPWKRSRARPTASSPLKRLKQHGLQSWASGVYTAAGFKPERHNILTCEQEF